MKYKSYIKDIKFYKYITILNLHKISNEDNPFYPSLSPKLFEELLKYIIKEFNVITFREIDKYQYSDKPNIILSFDDGFYDFLEYAMPILDKYNIRVNLNIIPQCIESGKPIWDVMLGDFLNQVDMDIINNLQFPNFHLKLTKYNKSYFGLALMKYIKEYTSTDRKKLWNIIEKEIKLHNILFTKM